MFQLMGKEINAILRAQTILIWTHDEPLNFDFTLVNNILPLLTGYIFLVAWAAVWISLSPLSVV